MDMIKIARMLGHAIQEDESYIKYKAAEKACDEDKELQDLIGEFNLKRMAINNEASKEDKSEEKMKELNQEMRDAYANVMKNENMAKYQNSKMDIDQKVQRVLAIITNSVQGEDPDTTDFTDNCTHDCSTCGGCH